MASAFRRTRRGVVAGLEEPERALLAQLFGEVHALLADDPDDPAGGGAAQEDPLAELVDIGTATRAPEDPALARLLPDATGEDAEAAADFRRYTEHGLRERKRAGLATAAATLQRPSPLVLTDEEARAWAVALTDVRLVLGERAGLRTDEDAERLYALADSLPDDDPLVATIAVYDFLTWLQESLVTVLAKALPDPPRRA